MLIEAKLPLSFQAEAISTAVFTYNASPTAMRKKIPLELWSNNIPTVKHMRIFECKLFYRNDIINKKKFDARVKPTAFIRYVRGQRAYWLWD